MAQKFFFSIVCFEEFCIWKILDFSITGTVSKKTFELDHSQKLTFNPSCKNQMNITPKIQFSNFFNAYIKKSEN